MPTRVSTIHMNMRYSRPENSGRSDNPWAMPMVNGLRVAPAKPSPAAKKHMHIPTIESYPMLMARGTKMIMNAMVSSDIPNTDPKRLKRIIKRVMMILSMPSHFMNLNLSSRRATPRKAIIETSIALLSFIIQNAPPISSMNIIISDLATNPSNRAEKTCHV